MNRRHINRQLTSRFTWSNFDEVTVVCFQPLPNHTPFSGMGIVCFIVTRKILITSVSSVPDFILVWSILVDETSWKRGVSWVTSRLNRPGKPLTGSSDWVGDVWVSYQTIHWAHSDLTRFGRSPPPSPKFSPDLLFIRTDTTRTKGTGR